MSENKQAEHAVDEVLEINTPTVNDSIKKSQSKMSVPMKVGIGLFVVAVVGGTAAQLLSSNTTPSPVAGAGADSNVTTLSGVNKADPTNPITNPEAISAKNKEMEKVFNDVNKDPSKSYIAPAEPFGENNGDKKDVTPPPPPPVLQTTSTATASSDKEPLDVMMARKYYTSVEGESVIEAHPPTYTKSMVRQVTQIAVNQNGGVQPQTDGVTPNADIAAGEVLYAITKTGLDSDVMQTPPKAVIHGGKWDGGILLGSAQFTSDKYFVLKFHMLTLGKKSFPIEAIAVTSDDWQSAGMVDEYHSNKVAKYSAMGFLGGATAVGQAKLQENSTTQTSVGSAGSTVTTQNGTKSNKDLAWIAGGGIAQSLTPIVQQEINDIKPQGKLYPEKEIGIMFLKPFIYK